MDFVNLRKTGNSWEFATEADLEDFVWANLNQLLGLTPLKRQYHVNGQFCDILASDRASAIKITKNLFSVKLTL
ncbi:hypothetical protein NIES25_19750 [Nostoc linckia NIES-25]|nr:hypothetical protein NIES25_19750 [Nostoc linckia NIES-25]